MTTPIDIHWAIGRLLEDVGNREGGDELEDAYNLVHEWWSQEPVGNRPSGILVYPESESPEELTAWYGKMGWLNDLHPKL